jgi:hypothetical protein
VTATELRAALRGALRVAVTERASAASASRAPIVASETDRTGASAVLALVLASLGAVILGRRERDEAKLVRRARRALDAITLRVRTLGPAADGLSIQARRLEAAVRRTRAHLGSIDATLRATRWTEGADARARREALLARRTAVHTDLERMTDELDSAVVRVAAMQSERHADTAAHEAAARVRAEVELAEEVEREIARL